MIAEAGTEDMKTFLTPAQKKRVAFIKGELHSGAGRVNAYIVFAHEEPGRSKSVPSVLDPFEAAKKAVEECDGKLYMERTLRVDHVGGAVGGVHAIGAGTPGYLDTRRTIFVGGLDFQTKEEELRVFFDALLASESEKQAPGEGDDAATSADSDGDDDDDATSKPPTTTVKPTQAPASMVSHVRLIRDLDTQLGKGIAYVEFKVHPVLSSFVSCPVDLSLIPFR